MCGIAGIASFDGVEVGRDVLQSMTNALSHRGPDGEGIWLDDLVGLGHRRLAIRDLSSAGSQPMLSRDGRFVVVFNGEIYNDRELKQQLEHETGLGFFSDCDTEVIAPAFSYWGIDAFLRFEGMFAIAIWDRLERTLTLARDPVGIKPLYFYRNNKKIAFASELKGLLPFYGKISLEAEAVRRFLAQGYVGPDMTMISGIEPLSPGSIVQFTSSGKIEKRRYWKPKREPKIYKLEEAVEKFNVIFDEVVKSHLISDVPVGILLSGGIDSCLVSKSLRGNANVKAYTASFSQTEFDESDIAHAVAIELGIKHTRVQFDQGLDIRSRFIKVANQMDGQLADSSSIAFYSVCETARKHVKVVLTGDGADEFFGGYETYRASILAKVLTGFVPTSFFLFVAHHLQPALAHGEGRPSLAEKAFRFSQGAATSPNFPHSQWRRYLQPDQESQLFNSHLIDYDNDALKSYGEAAGGAANSFLDKCLLADQNYYLPADMLVKADMMSMAHGLEVRVPFLDRRVMDFASELSPRLLVPLTGPDKKLLRTVLGNFTTVPKLNKIPKKGFNVPVAMMLRNQLKTLGEELLIRNPDILSPELKPDGIRKLWNEHQNRTRNNGYALWALLTLATWKSGLPF